MDISSRWYKAAGASLIAGAITARYVARWRRSRSLRRDADQERLPTGGRYFIGLDLTDPYAERRRPCTVAVLDPELHCQFSLWDYNEQGSGIIPVSALGRAFLLAIDGPQGLAGQEEAQMRASERAVHAPGHSTYELPVNGKPYGGFIAGSVKLFYHLVTSGGRFRLLGLGNVPTHDANLMEVYPGAGWKALAGLGRLPRKATVEGRKTRLALLQAQGVQFADSGPFSHDQLDAAMAAWSGYRFNRGQVSIEGSAPWLDSEYHVIREGYIVRPTLALGDADADRVEAYAPTG